MIPPASNGVLDWFVELISLELTEQQYLPFNLREAD